MPSYLRGRTVVKSSNNQIVSADGNVSYPGLAFQSNPQTGLYFDSGNVCVSVNGQQVASLSQNGMTVYANVSCGNISANGSQLSDLLVSANPPTIANVFLSDAQATNVGPAVIPTETANTYILVEGTDFQAGCLVRVGTSTYALQTAFQSPTTLHVRLPSLQSGQYNATVINTDGQIATRVNGIVVSGVPTWTTGSNLGSIEFGQVYSIHVEAVSDSNVTYSSDSVPAGVSLSTSGVLSGNNQTESGAILSIDVVATDEEIQSTSRVFFLTYLSAPPAYNGKIAPADLQINAQFGAATTMSEDGLRAVVGTYSGAVYIFRYEEGTWVEEQKLVKTGSSFGQSISMSGDGSTLLIGAWGDDGNSITDSGSVYVYNRTATTWTESQVLVSPNSETSGRFGHACAVSADATRIVVGALNENVTTYTDAGTAYIFVKSAGTWVFEQKLVNSNSEAWSGFGYSCSISGNGSRVVIGAYYKTVSGQYGAGSAYVFVRSDTTWSEESILVEPTPREESLFGWSCSISSDASRIAIGAPVYQSGAAYVYGRTGSSWTLEQALVPSDGSTGDLFGRSCCISADGLYILVGGLGDQSFTGAAYAYGWNGSTWAELQKILGDSTVEVGDTSLYFGVACSLSGDGSYGIVGESRRGADNYGAAYIVKYVNGAWIY